MKLRVEGRWRTSEQSSKLTTHSSHQGAWLAVCSGQLVRGTNTLEITRFVSLSVRETVFKFRVQFGKTASTLQVFTSRRERPSSSASTDVTRFQKSDFYMRPNVTGYRSYKVGRVDSRETLYRYRPRSETFQNTFVVYLFPLFPFLLVHVVSYALPFLSLLPTMTIFPSKR